MFKVGDVVEYAGEFFSLSDIEDNADFLLKNTEMARGIVMEVDRYGDCIVQFPSARREALLGGGIYLHSCGGFDSSLRSVYLLTDEDEYFTYIGNWRKYDITKEDYWFV